MYNVISDDDDGYKQDEILFITIMIYYLIHYLSIIFNQRICALNTSSWSLPTLHDSGRA